MDIEKLLTHRPFVRALARSLVRDDARADDLVQDTYLTAMKNPPRHSRSLRAWLGAIVRNLARTQNRAEWRRTKHERIRPRKAAEIGVRALPSPEETLEKAIWHQRLVEAAMTLDEPYRTTLLMRYFEELDSSEIARLQGVPAATVRTRVRRGLERLRAKLDEASPGGRAKWMAGLLLLARPPGEAIAASAAAEASRQTPVRWGVPAASAAVVLVVGAMWLVLRAANDPSTERVVTRPGTPPAAIAEERGESLPRTLLLPEPQFGNTLDVVVLDDGRPADGAAVVLSRAPDHPWRAVPRGVWQTEQRAVADRQGAVRFAGVPDGYARIAAWRHGRARTLAYAYLPQSYPVALVIDLAPQKTRPLALVDAATGRPVQGAIVWLEDEGGVPREPGPDRVVTGANGEVRLSGLADGEIAPLRVAAPLHREARAVLPIATIALEATERMVRWPLAGDAGSQETQVELVRPHGGERTPARIEDDALVAGPLANSDWPEHWALLPDGRFARLESESGRTQGDPISFRQPVRLTVAIRDDRGAPVARARLALADAATGTRLFERHETWTDDEGDASLPVYAGDPVVLLYRDRTATRWRTLRSFDPARGDARIEVRLPRARTLRIELGGLREWALYANRERVRPERESDGSYSLPWRHWNDAGRIDLHMLARGYEPVSRSFGREGAHVWRVPLRRASILAVRVRRAEPSQSVRLALADAATGDIVRRGAGRYLLDEGPDGVVRDATIPAGRYVLLDLGSGTRGAPFVARPDGATIELDFDLTQAHTAAPLLHGRVVAPLGVDLERTHLVASPGGVVAVEHDGSFRLPWPDAGPVELEAVYPGVTRAPVRAIARTLDAPLLLELAPSASAHCELAAGPHVQSRGGTAPGIVATDADGRAIRVDARVEGRVLRFEGLAPGRWTLLFDLPGCAPAKLQDVVLGAGDNDLGTLTLPRGTEIRFRVETRTGALPPALVVAAQAEDAPRYQRSIRTQGEAMFALPGLGAGRFRVTAWDRYTGLRVFTTVIECDGASPREIAIPIR